MKIGRTAGDCQTITNIVSFSERVISPDGNLVDPLSVINVVLPSGVHQNQKYWELELVLDTDWLPDTAAPTSYWARTQKVNAANTLPAIVDNGENTAIEYFVASIRRSDGVVRTLTYANVATNVLWCTGETTEVVNDETGTRHQTTTYKFICLQERVVV